MDPIITVVPACRDYCFKSLQGTKWKDLPNTCGGDANVNTGRIYTIIAIPLLLLCAP